MLELIQKSLELERRFDSERCRHYLNGRLVVMHCHHYATLYSQLAMDAGETQLLSDVAEETFHGVLTQYFADHDVKTVVDRLEIATQYFGAMGLGRMVVDYLGADSGQVTLAKSHVDEGWVKKWGTYDAPVNYIGAGYIAGMFAAVNDKPLGTYQVRETESIVKGDPQSRFAVYRA